MVKQYYISRKVCIKVTLILFVACLINGSKQNSAEEIIKKSKPFCHCPEIDVKKSTHGKSSTESLSLPIGAGLCRCPVKKLHRYGKSPINEQKIRTIHNQKVLTEKKSF